MKNYYKLGLLTALSVFTLFSCTKDETEEEKGMYEDGMFVSNEGAWGNSNASVSFISNSGEVQNGIFNTVNSRILGDVLQSVSMDDDFTYLVLNASNKVEVVTSDDFVEAGVISGLDSPRYIAFGEDNAYVSQWGGTGNVAVISKGNFGKVKEIEVGNGPEGLLSVNDEIWVANSGGYGSDNTISVISDESLEVKTTITLTGDDPKGFVLDSDGDVWVLCSGHITYNPEDWSVVSETPSMLIEIDANSKEVKSTVEISTTLHPNHLRVDAAGKNVYYGGGFGVAGVYVMSTSASEAPSTPILDNSLYGFNVANDGSIWGTEAPTFTDAGKVIKFDSQGSELDTYTVGIGPNGVSFNN